MVYQKGAQYQRVLAAIHAHATPASNACASSTASEAATESPMRQLEAALPGKQAAQEQGQSLSRRRVLVQSKAQLGDSPPAPAPRPAPQGSASRRSDRAPPASDRGWRDWRDIAPRPRRYEYCRVRVPTRPKRQAAAHRPDHAPGAARQRQSPRSVRRRQHPGRRAAIGAFRRHTGAAVRADHSAVRRCGAAKISRPGRADDEA